jgi:hypothetical protein
LKTGTIRMSPYQAPLADFRFLLQEETATLLQRIDADPDALMARAAEEL